MTFNHSINFTCIVNNKCAAKCGGVTYCSNKTFGFSKPSICSKNDCKWRNFIVNSVSWHYQNEVKLVVLNYQRMNPANDAIWISLKKISPLTCVMKYPIDWAFAVCSAVLCAELIECPSEEETLVVLKTDRDVGFRVGWTPCFSSSCFFNCRSSKIFRLVNSVSLLLRIGEFYIEKYNITPLCIWLWKRH